MKCPKCGYLGFEQVDRCRNCGYEFSLSPQPPAPELSLKESIDEPNPLEDLSFLKAAETPTEVESAADLPLFVSAAMDDQPLIVKPSPPRQPLAVRRATPEVPRVRSESRAQSSFDLAFDAEPSPASTPLAPPRRAARPSLFDDGPATHEPARAEHAPESAAHGQNASLMARFVAVVIDLVILACVDLVAVYFTLQLSGLALIEIGILPKVPLLAFLILQNGGYLVGFTAGGQTLGKMVLGIRVIALDESESMTVGRAFQRTVMWAILAIPAGLGFLSAVFSSDRRGWHDRLAGTRVVRASA